MGARLRQPSHVGSASPAPGPTLPAADAGEETPAMRQLLADIGKMPPEHLKKLWLQGQMLAARDLAMLPPEPES
jgi:hypothetical protein